LSAYEAAKEFSIPKSTILQHFNGIMKRYIWLSYTLLHGPLLPNVIHDCPHYVDTEFEEFIDLLSSSGLNPGMEHIQYT
jgi:hypothetical protein